MIEDKLLILRFKRGSSDALCRIYDKYKVYLLKVACALLNDVHIAEDVVHEVFLGFAKSGDTIKLEGSLKSYLRTCVANLARDRMRVLRRHGCRSQATQPAVSDAKEPSREAIWSEQSHELSCALALLPYEQRETIVLHLRGGMKFREIAAMQGVSINSVKSRYRYGLDKLRSALNSEANIE